MPQNREVLRHLRRINDIATKAHYDVLNLQPLSIEPLRRAMMHPASLIYLLGHAEPVEGLALSDRFLPWTLWQQVFHENPNHIVLNCCYGQPGIHWQPPKTASFRIVGHEGLIERNAAYCWGEKQLKAMLWRTQVLPNS